MWAKRVAEVEGVERCDQAAKCRPIHYLRHLIARRGGQPANEYSATTRMSILTTQSPRQVAGRATASVRGRFVGMRHIIVSTLVGVTLLTSLTGAAAAPRATSSTPVSRGTRTILVDGVHSTTTGQFAVKLYLTPRNKIRGQMTLTDAATSTRVVYTVRDQVVVARGVVGEQRVRETHSLSEFFLIDLTGNQPTVKLAKIKPTCPGLIASSSALW